MRGNQRISFSENRALKNILRSNFLQILSLEISNGRIHLLRSNNSISICFVVEKFHKFTMQSPPFSNHPYFKKFLVTSFFSLNTFFKRRFMKFHIMYVSKFPHVFVSFYIKIAFYCKISKKSPCLILVCNVMHHLQMMQL